MKDQAPILQVNNPQTKMDDCWYHGKMLHAISIVLICFWMPFTMGSTSKKHQVNQVNQSKPIKIGSTMGYRSQSSQKGIDLANNVDSTANLDTPS